jgi:hypothetical protein
MYTYKYVEVPLGYEINKNDSHSVAIQSYEQVINKYANDGWEYVGTDQLESMYKQGCLASIIHSIPIMGVILEKGNEHKLIKLLVFRKTA